MPHDLRLPAHRALVRAGLAALLALSLLAAAGCGGDDKPSYCSDRTNLENAVKDLPSAAKSGGTSGLQTQLNTIETDANDLISAAKDDFPSETSTLKSTIDQMKTSVEGLGSNPTASQLAPLVLNATAVVNAVKSFTDATQSACD